MAQDVCKDSPYESIWVVTPWYMLSIRTVYLSSSSEAWYVGHAMSGVARAGRVSLAGICRWKQFIIKICHSNHTLASLCKVWCTIHCSMAMSSLMQAASLSFLIKLVRDFCLYCSCYTCVTQIPKRVHDIASLLIVLRKVAGSTVKRSPREQTFRGPATPL